jgi:hypothetical protein
MYGGAGFSNIPSEAREPYCCHAFKVYPSLVF